MSDTQVVPTEADQKKRLASDHHVLDCLLEGCPGAGPGLWLYSIFGGHMEMQVCR